MKAEELRIGNYVTGDGDHKKRVATVGLAEIEYAHLFNPIPLTEEWLLKFGFNENRDKLYSLYIRPNVTLRINIEPANKDNHFIDIVERENGEDYTNFLNRIKYVHQLQNLYFCLTGEELTINL